MAAPNDFPEWDASNNLLFATYPNNHTGVDVWVLQKDYGEQGSRWFWYHCNDDNSPENAGPFTDRVKEFWNHKHPGSTWQFKAKIWHP